MASPHKLQDQAVNKAVRSLTVEEVRDLVYQMGVPLNELDDIASEYLGAQNKRQHFVKKWLDMDVDASWAKLVAGLRTINMNSLAAKIESAHLSRVPSSGSVSLVPSSALCLPPASVSVTPAGPLTRPPPPYPSSPSPFSPYPQITVSSTQRMEVVITCKEHLEKEFSKIKFDTQKSLERESRSQQFVCRFKHHLLDLPLTRKQVHIRFFARNEDDILAADTIKKLFSIVRRHCNYNNYEIILHIVKRFCTEKLKQRMLSYCNSLTAFEKTTTVDVYLRAISARPDGAISAGFVKMTMKMNKAPSQCTLHEIRELKESIDEEASLECYAMYIDNPVEGSVCAVLRVPERVGWMVGVVLTPDFRQKHLISEVTVTVRRWRGESEESLTQYLNYEFSGRGDVEAVTSLISAGADVNNTDEWGESPLMEAARSGRTEVISLLVKAGAALDLQNKWGDCPLVEATRSGRTEVVSLLVEAGAALDLQNKWGDCSLMEAARRGETEVVSLLVKAGAALDLQNKRGDSTVMIATRHYQLPVLKQLVRVGADLNLQNMEGLTALMISSISGRTELTGTLLSGQNISVDLQTSTGLSALFFAAERGDVDTVDLLIMAGANPRVTDQNGLTAEAVAAASGHGEVYQLLSRLTGEPSDLGHDVAETGATSEEQPLSTTEPDMGEPEVSQPDPSKTATHQQPPLPVASIITQRVREAVKNARKAFRRLEVRVLRPDKEKTQLEVRGQEGEERVRGKWRPHLPPEEDVREEYLSRLS